MFHGFGIMARHNDCLAILLREGEKQRRNRFRVAVVQVAGRFIGENQCGIIGELQSHGDALLLAAAQFFRPLVALGRKADHLQQPFDALFAR